MSRTNADGVSLLGPHAGEVGRRLILISFAVVLVSVGLVLHLMLR